MRLITRHILRALTAPFCWGVAALTGMLLLNNLAGLIDRFGGKGLPAGVIAEAILLALPALLVLTIPMSVLVATLYAYSTLAADLEMMAMYANGLSVWRMVRPALVAAIGVSAINFLIFDQVVPLSNSRYKTLTYLVQNTTPTLQLRPEELNEMGLSGYVLRAHEIRQEDGWLFRVIIYDLLGTDDRTVIHADSGRMARSPSGQDLLLTLYDGDAVSFSPTEPTRVERSTFGVNVIRLTDVERAFKRSLELAERGDREKSGCELQDGIDESRWRRDNANRQREQLTTRDLRSLAGLPPLPPPALQTMPEFPPHCTGPWGRVQRLLERVLLPTPLAAQVPATVQDTSHRRSSRAATKDSLALVGVTSPEPMNGDSTTGQELAPPAAAAAPDGYLVPPLRVSPPRTDGLVSSMTEVRGARLTARETGHTVREYAVEYHKKFAIPLACFCFVLVGVALALKFPGSGIGLVIGGSLIIFMAFYVLLIGGENLANDGVVSPAFAMYAPVVALTLLGLGAVAAADREMGSTRSTSIRDLIGEAWARFRRHNR
jgi:lipopolysaccharide export system permease protein